MEQHPAGYPLYVGVDIAATTFTTAWIPPGTSPSPPVTCRGRLRRMGIAPGNVIAFRAQVDACTLDGRRIASDIEEEIGEWPTAWHSPGMSE